MTEAVELCPAFHCRNTRQSPIPINVSVQRGTEIPIAILEPADRPLERGIDKLGPEGGAELALSIKTVETSVGVAVTVVAAAPVTAFGALVVVRLLRPFRSDIRLRISRSVPCHCT